jgi:hypothetical protein
MLERDVRQRERTEILREGGRQSRKINASEIKRKEKEKRKTKT